MGREQRAGAEMVHQKGLGVLVGLDLGFLKAVRWTNKWGRKRFGWEKIKITQKDEKHNVLHKNYCRFLPQKS